MKSPVPNLPVSSQRGAALVTAALALLLISVLAATFMSTVTGERSMSSNVHVAKGSLYSADAGVRAAQQHLANVGRARLDSLRALYTGTGPIIAQPNLFFPAGAIVASATSPAYSTSATITFSDSALADTGQAYDFRYQIVSNGTLGANGARSVQSDGVLRVSATRGSFADYLIFTNEHTMANGNPIWFTSSGYFDGRVHTNTQVRIAYQPTFEDLLSSVNSKAWYYNNGSPVERNANNNGTIDVPNLYGGFQRGVGNAPMPANSYGQQNAAIGLSPTSTTQPSNSTIRTQLGLPSSTSPPPDGMYLPNNGGSPPLLTGGIYVQGDLNQCVASVDSLGRQVYTMTQGGSSRTITVDVAANRTYSTVGATTTTYYNAPRGILYTNGDIDDLGGPGRSGGEPLPAIANGIELLVTATEDITLQEDMVYQDFEDGRSVLGIFAAGGDVIVGSGAPDDMHLDAFVMAVGDPSNANDGVFTVAGYNSGDPRGTFHLRGGMVSEFYGPFYTFDSNGDQRTGFARDFVYDRRGRIPPYYPSTMQFVVDDPTARTLAWKEL
ncbi:MAG TPA: DUF4900 domain-containing protein [Candidatus Limnocylindria bacterium]|nr:DUF4900 domain-containing protein [Candidatus Limnocylindria bacterium]